MRVTPLPIVRWVGLGALLAAELLVLTLRFNTGSVVGNPAWWAQLLAAMPYVLRFGGTVAAGALLFGHAELWDELRRIGRPTTPSHSWLGFLVGHLAFLLFFFWLTGVVFAGDLADWSPFPLAWAVAWLATGGTVLALWGLACLPAPGWWRLLCRAWKAMLLGGVAGPVVYTISPVANLLWHPVGRATLFVVHALLSLLFPGQVVCDPAQFEIGTETFQIQIYPSCSGYAGVAMMTAFLGAYLWAFRRRLRFPAALLLLPLGAVGVWLLNSVRLVLLIAIGSWGWPDVAMGGFHKNAGWLAFTAVALGMVILAGRTSWFSAVPRAENAEDRQASPTTAYLGPFLTILLITMAAGAFSSDFDWLYPLRVVAVVVVVWLCRRSYAELRSPCSWEAPAFGIAAFVVWLALAPSGAKTEVGWPAALAAVPWGWSAAWLAVRLVGYGVTAPLAEELAFRGYLTRRLMSADFLKIPAGRFSWFSFFASSAAFGAMHGRWWLPGTLAGMLFALAPRRRGRLIDAVLAHATTNLLVASYVLWTGQWRLWS